MDIRNHNWFKLNWKKWGKFRDIDMMGDVTKGDNNKANSKKKKKKKESQI